MAGPKARVVAAWLVAGSLTVGAASCGSGSRAATPPPASSSTSVVAPASTTVAPQRTTTMPTRLHPPHGNWQPAGRRVGGLPAVYETTLVPPGGSQPAGMAWMDTRLLSARLYSGSQSPGGGPFRYTAPVRPAQAASLVAAFNGGFQMNAARGGYYTDARLVVPLVAGAASLVFYSDGTVNVGAWDSTVAMSARVVGVRQNLVPLVADGRPTPQAASADWLAWGNTCGFSSCAPSVPSIDHQWRSGVGVTAQGALVYVTGPALDPLQLAELLVRGGVVRGMELDINPAWTVLVTYQPSTVDGLAAPSNGSKLLPDIAQGPWTFFESWWARDFVTLSARG